MSDFSERHEVEGVAMHTPEFERQIAETMAEREVRRETPHVVTLDLGHHDGAVRPSVMLDGVPVRCVRDVRVAAPADGFIEVTLTLIAGAVGPAEARDREATK